MRAGEDLNGVARDGGGSIETAASSLGRRSEMIGAAESCANADVPVNDTHTETAAHAAFTPDFDMALAPEPCRHSIIEAPHPRTTTVTRPSRRLHGRDGALTLINDSAKRDE